MTTNFWAVYEFNVAFGIFVVKNMDTNKILDDEDGIHLLKNNEKLVKLRYSLIEEEINELENDGINANNVTEIIDALSDILYVVYGAGASFGINIDYFFKEFMDENASISGIVKTNFNMVKNQTNYINLNRPVSELFNDHKKQVNISLSLIKVHLKLLQNSLETFNYNEIVVNLVNLTYHTYELGCILNIDLDKSFNIVHKSNMSKLCNTIEEAKLTVENYTENDTRYDTPSYRKSDLGDYYVVYNESTNKILKSINYTPANFESIL